MSEKHTDLNVNVSDARLIDPMRNEPPWLKMVASFSAFGIVSCLFVWLVVKVVNGQDDSVKQYNTLLERFDKSLEAHDTRMRDWMKTVSERNGMEHEKTRLELKSMSESVKLLKDAIVLMKQ